LLGAENNAETQKWRLVALFAILRFAQGGTSSADLVPIGAASHHAAAAGRAAHFSWVEASPATQSCRIQSLVLGRPS
jgi:hypothetical protein